LTTRSGATLGSASSRVDRARTRAGIVLAAPALLLLLAFFVVPVAASLGLSFTDFDIYALARLESLRFVGIGNYRDLVGSAMFSHALWNTIFFVLVGAPLSIAVSLATALLLDARLTRWKGLFRSIFFLPVVTTLVAVAVVWRYLYHARDGLLNDLLGTAGFAPIDWLGDPRWAMPAIILMAVWKGFGFNMVIFLAALQSIPERLYEAARIDGAGPLQQLRRVTLPLLLPTLLIVGLLTVIGHFQLFAEPYVMTQGGPAHSTLSLVLLMYEEGFRWWNMGYASAVAFLLFGIILLCTLLQLRMRRLFETPSELRRPAVGRSA
jgi:multiple sugar transport system permease protein